MVVCLDKTFLAGEGSLSSRKHFIASGLSTARGSDKHETVTHDSRIEQLEDLLDESRDELDVLLLADLLD